MRVSVFFTTGQGSREQFSHLYSNTYFIAICLWEKNYHRIWQGASTKGKADKGLGFSKTQIGTEKLSFFTTFLPQGSRHNAFKPL